MSNGEVSLAILMVVIIFHLYWIGNKLELIWSTLWDIKESKR